MGELTERIARVSSYLQELLNPEVFPIVQNAVEARDKNALVKVCRKAGISEMYIGAIVSLLLTVGPRQKWPLDF